MTVTRRPAALHHPFLHGLTPCSTLPSKAASLRSLTRLIHPPLGPTVIMLSCNGATMSLTPMGKAGGRFVSIAMLSPAG